MQNATKFFDIDLSESFSLFLIISQGLPLCFDFLIMYSLSGFYS